MSQPSRTSGVYRVLVVDDDPIHRDTLVDYLALAGYEARQADNGMAALELMASFEPDLLLMDVNMPVLDGYETLKRVRSDWRFRHLPVLLVSASDRTNLKVKGLELGADDYITKPFERAELLARVRAGLRRALRYQKLEGAMVGSLQEVGIDGLLQTLHLGMRAARVKLPDVDAEIETRQGALLGCRFRKFEGADALSRIMLQPHGRFVVDFVQEEPSADRSRLSIDHALVDALVAMDEVKLVLARVGSSETVLDIVAQDTGSAGLEAMRKAFPIRLGDLVVAMAGDVKANAEAIASAFDQRLIRTVE